MLQTSSITMASQPKKVVVAAAAVVVDVAVVVVVDLRNLPLKSGQNWVSDGQNTFCGYCCCFYC